jgi:hypothetical protein
MGCIPTTQKLRRHDAGDYSYLVSKLSRLIQNYGDVFWNRLGCGSQALGVDLGQKRV